MTREEAIFCEKSYIGETNCTDCKYYGTETCQSRESHRMAIKALEQEPQTFKWCTGCKEYDQEKHCCHRWSKVIRDTVEEMKQEPIKPMVEIDLYSVIKQKYIEREVLDKIITEVEIWRKDDTNWSDIRLMNIEDIIDKYKAETGST